MNKDFDHRLADHLSARERAARGRGEAGRDGPLAAAGRDARSGGDGQARVGRLARGAALLGGWFR
jgi:hypothetical protein